MGESLVCVCGLSIYLFLLCSYSVPTTVCLQVHEISRLFLTFLLFLVKTWFQVFRFSFFWLGLFAAVCAVRRRQRAKIASSEILYSGAAVA